MGLFSLLFSQGKGKPTGKPQSPTRLESKRKINFKGDLVQIPSIGFFGTFNTSSSGEWVICWRDGVDEGGGYYVLCNAVRDEIVFQGKVKRPNSAKVANTGSFSIEDWEVLGELSGTFYVFSSGGKQLIKKRFAANILNSGISDNGKYAICQTANAPTGEDGNRLVAFDVESRAELFSIHPRVWASSYKFAEDTSHFGAVINHVGTFRYDTLGNFVDADKYDEARLRCDRFDIILPAAAELLGQPELNTERARAILESVARARSLGADKEQGWKAFVLKCQGLAHEFLGNSEDALSAFEEALTIDPKIGVKRKADSLRKKLVNKKGSC